LRRRLILFARAPLPGRVKSRLAADIGEQAAAGVYARFLYATLLDLAESPTAGIDIHLSVASPEDAPTFSQAFSEFTVTVQPQGDLGVRLSAAFGEAFQAGVDAAAVVATDVPALDTAIVRKGFHVLDRAPGVVGPCPDGGYYLIGLRAPGASLFHPVDWGTERVLAQTEQLAEEAGIRLERLPPLLDIDTVEDLAKWARAPDRVNAVDETSSASGETTP